MVWQCVKQCVAPGGNITAWQWRMAKANGGVAGIASVEEARNLAAWRGVSGNGVCSDYLWRSVMA